MSSKDKKKILISDPIIPAIDYKGAVEIILLDKNGKAKHIHKHNAGKIGLFTAITRALSGDPITDYIPTKVMGYAVDGELDRELFSQWINYSTKPITYRYEDGNYIQTAGTKNNVIQYTFIVPISNVLYRRDTIQKLKLANNREEECAEIVLDTPISLKNTSSILIYWRMLFTNTEN